MSNQREAHLTWNGTDLNFEVTTNSGYKFNFGSPAATDKSSPMDVLLAAVAGCTAMDVVSMLQKMREPLKGFEVKIQGRRAEDHPKVYTWTEITYIIHGKDVDPSSVQRAIELSQAKYCSASIMFKQAGVELNTNYRIEE